MSLSEFLPFYAWIQAEGDKKVGQLFIMELQEILATVPLATVPQNFSFEKPPYRTFFRYRTPKKQV